MDSHQHNPTSDSAPTPVQLFLNGLSSEERMLIVLLKELYEGSWEAMLSDLHNRLEGKPYIFKLANRIRDDIARIDKLVQFEQRANVKLADYIQTSDS